MDYIKHYKERAGFTKISGIGDGGMELTELGLIKLGKGGTYSSEAAEFEHALIVLCGDCSISVEGFEFSIIEGRKNVFSGKPHAAYIPAGKGYTVKAETDLEIAAASSPSTLRTEPYLILPDDVKDIHIGQENYARSAYLVLTDSFPSEHFFIGEAFVPSGNHATYPPHRHDFDNLPEEVDMEEIYFFRFRPQQGYGIQKIYTDDGSVDFTFTVKNNDAALLHRGYHTVINTPGYTMYYLWIMAGAKNRKFLSVMDPEHKWVAKK